LLEEDCRQHERQAPTRDEVEKVYGRILARVIDGASAR